MAEDPHEHLSRPCRHLKWERVTVVSGVHYIMLENPFPFVSSTFRAGCQNFFPLSSVVWDDTGENVKEYRDRVYYSVPWKSRMRLMFLGNLFEGALNLRLDKSGQPLPPADGG